MLIVLRPQFYAHQLPHQEQGQKQTDGSRTARYDTHTGLCWALLGG